VEEAALLAGPVCGLKARLEQLLVEWPEHPVLVQLSAICDRLTGMPSSTLTPLLCHNPHLDVKVPVTLNLNRSTT